MDFGKHLAMFSTFTGLVVMVCVGVMSMAVAGASTPYEKQSRINEAARNLVLAKEQVMQAEQETQYHRDMAQHYMNKLGGGEDMLANVAKVINHEAMVGASEVSRLYSEANRSYREGQLDDVLDANI